VEVLNQAQQALNENSRHAIVAEEIVKPRLARASDLKEIFNAFQKNFDGTFTVTSQWTPGKSYKVDPRTDSCSCPDSVYRRIQCKHLLAVSLGGV
jgi:hypothetical protein